MTRRSTTRGFQPSPDAPQADRPHSAPLSAIAVAAGGMRMDLRKPGIGAITRERLLAALPDQLARINRWNGAPHLPYTVAQHAALVAQRMRDLHGPLAARAGLHHDDHEIFLSDIPFPTEALIEDVAPGYIFRTRAALDAVLFPLLGLQYPIPDDLAAALARAHDEVVATEMRDLSGHRAPELDALERRGVRPLKQRIRALAWPKAAELWEATRDALAAESGLPE